VLLEQTFKDLHAFVEAMAPQAARNSDTA